MLSNWNVWDFFKNHPKILDVKHTGLYSFFFPDPYTAKIAKDILDKHQNLRVIAASEVTPEWLEENLCTLSLFGGSESYYIPQAEDLSKAAQEHILERYVDFNTQYFILCFLKDSAFRKKITSLNGKHLVIEAPKFWEMDKFFDFLADYYEVRLAYEAKQFFLEIITHDPSSFHVALNIVKLNFSHQSEVSLDDLKSVLEQGRLDQFALASLFSRKEKVKFFEKLLKADPDFDTLRQFFSFLQGHLIKLADPRLLEKKPRPSKYDKEIIGLSKLWKTDELKNEIRFFASLEILSKEKNQVLFQQLRSYYLKLIA